jgi:hypothetical protein
MIRYRLLRLVWSRSQAEQRRWIEHIEDHIEALLAAALAPHPEGSVEYTRVRWTGIRLRGLLRKLRRALGLPPF